MPTSVALGGGLPGASTAEFETSAGGRTPVDGRIILLAGVSPDVQVNLYLGVGTELGLPGRAIWKFPGSYRSALNFPNTLAMLLVLSY